MCLIALDFIYNKNIIGSLKIITIIWIAVQISTVVITNIFPERNIRKTVFMVIRFHSMKGEIPQLPLRLSKNYK